MPDEQDYDLKPIEYQPVFDAPEPTPTDRLPSRFGAPNPELGKKIVGGMAKGLVNQVMTPGIAAQPIEPATPGMWSDEDEARRIATENAAVDWAPATALNMMRTGTQMTPEGAVGTGGTNVPIRAYHGSPHDFEPSDYRSGGAVGHVPSTTHKARFDVLTRHAEDFGKFAVSNALLIKGFGSLDIKGRGVVLSLMRELLQDNEIGKAVVGLAPVDVMHVLAGKKFSAQTLFNKPSMLVDLLPVNANDLIASRVKAVDVLAPYVTRATAECPLVGAHGASLLEKALAARSAKKGDLHVRSKIPYPYDLVPINYDPFADDAKHAKGGAVKLSHASVGYVAQSTHLPQKCGGCTMFLPPSGCTLVRSPIKASGWCRRFVKEKHAPSE